MSKVGHSHSSAEDTYQALILGLLQDTFIQAAEIKSIVSMQPSSIVSTLFGPHSRNVVAIDLHAHLKKLFIQHLTQFSGN